MAQYSGTFRRIQCSCSRESVIWAKYFSLSIFSYSLKNSIFYLWKRKVTGCICFRNTQQLDSLTVIGLCVFLMSLVWSFLLCSAAASTTNIVASVGDIVYNENWTQYPPVYRKCVLLMILRSQFPVDFKGFEVVRCSLKTFSKVRFKNFHFWKNTWLSMILLFSFGFSFAKQLSFIFFFSDNCHCKAMRTI